MPTQVTFFSAGINTYSLCIGLAALVGGVLALWQARGSVEALSRRLTGVLIIAISTMIAGRAGYVLLHADYFSQHLAEIVSSASPGLWEHAAIIGGCAGWWIAKRVRQPVTATTLVITASLVGIGASLGCIPNGCAYGREVFWTDGWVWALRADWPDAYTLNNPRLPTQVFMIAWLLVCLLPLMINRLRHVQRPLPLVPVWVALFACGDFIIQFLRAPSAPVFAGLSGAQCADVVLFAASMLNLILVKIRLPILRH